MYQRALASFAGLAAGSVVTWMTMDNEMMKMKASHKAELKARDEAIACRQFDTCDNVLLSTMVLGTLTTCTITMLKALGYQ
jgi:hypothetical protein